MTLKQILDQVPRLRAWADIGPVQRAEVEQFAQLILDSQVTAITCDGVGVQPGDQVWIIDGVGTPRSTTVRTTQALTNYTLFGLIPVAHSWSTEAAAENYRKYQK